LLRLTFIQLLPFDEVNIIQLLPFDEVTTRNYWPDKSVSTEDIVWGSIYFYLAYKYRQWPIKGYNCFISLFTLDIIYYYMTLLFNILLPWYSWKIAGVMVRVMMINATFNNISFILWRWILLVEEIGVPGENYQPAASPGCPLSFETGLQWGTIVVFSLTLYPCI
jgi:hypothetical protein